MFKTDKRKRQSAKCPAMAFLKFLSSSILQQPGVVQPTIYHCVYKYIFSNYLKKQHIVLFKKQLSVFVVGYQRVKNPGAAFRHGFQCFYLFDEFRYQPLRRRFADLSKKTRMMYKHLGGGSLDSNGISPTLVWHPQPPELPDSSFGPFHQ